MDKLGMIGTIGWIYEAQIKCFPPIGHACAVGDGGPHRQAAGDPATHAAEIEALYA